MRYCISLDDMIEYYRNLIHTGSNVCGAGAGILFHGQERNVMTVFKGYVRGIMKNAGLILLYLGIFSGDNGTSGGGQ